MFDKTYEILDLSLVFLMWFVLYCRTILRETVYGNLGGVLMLYFILRLQMSNHRHNRLYLVWSNERLFTDGIAVYLKRVLQMTMGLKIQRNNRSFHL